MLHHSARLSSAISIHALHEESDLALAHAQVDFLFQSTLSMRRATYRILDIMERA